MWRFHARLLKRQWRLGAVKLFCAAIAVACAVTFSITLLSNRLERLFDEHAKEVLAADLVLTSSTPLRVQQASIIEQAPLEQARALSFRTMARAGERLMLTSTKAVSDGYPLRGQLQIAARLFGAARAVRHGPPRGEVWVEERVLHELGVAPGGQLHIGAQALRITQVLVYEPDRGDEFYSLTPRVMMHWEDVPATGVVQPGSRVKYRHMFAGPRAALADLRAALGATLQINQEFVSVREANRRLFANLEQARGFLHLAALMAILLGAVASALVSFQYVVEMSYQYAVLRCLGLAGGLLRAAVLLPLLGFTLLALGLGLGLGAAVHLLMLKGLSGLLPLRLPPPGPEPFLLGGVTALIVIAGFAWPFLRRLWQVPPRLLLHRNAARHHLPRLASCTMLLGLAGLVYLGTREVLLAVQVLAATGLGVLLSWFALQRGIRWLARRARHARVGPRLAVRMLAANRVMVAVQVLAVAVTVFALALMQTTRDDLIQSWRSKIPDNAANFFAINLFPDELPRFVAALQGHNIAHSPPYPIVRGRLRAVNGVPIQEYAGPASGREHESLERDLALTWGLELPHENTIVAGAWHDPEHPPPEAQVSVERDVAESLELGLGDMLEFSVDAQPFQARVSSIRTVQWESFTPNFYMIFYPGALQGLSHTYLMTMRVAAEQRGLLAEFVGAFPGVTFFDVDFLLTRIQGIILQVSRAVEMVLYFSLLAGLMVFASIEMILRRNRAYSAAICKALGAGSRQVQRIFRLQLILIGVAAGLLAWLLNLLIGWIVVAWYIGGDYVFNAGTAALCLLLTPAAVYLAGRASLRHYSRASAHTLLQRERA